MSVYKIVDINVKMNPKHNPLKKQLTQYLTNSNCFAFEVPNIEKEIKEYQNKNNHLSIGMCEYIMYGSYFYTKLIDYDIVLLHASAVSYKNEVYLFSAPSGTGKSTHTKFWTKVFNDAYIINDDKPALKLIDNVLYAYGTPFSGKVDLSVNIKMPVRAIYFIERSKDNWIKQLDKKDAITYLLSETVRSRSFDKTEKILKMVEKIIERVPIFKLGINISEDAVLTAYNAVNKGDSNEN